MNAENNHEVIIALGTNRNTSAGDVSRACPVFDAALGMMQPWVTGIVRSAAVLTEPVGIVSPLFCNQLIACKTTLPLVELERVMKEIEKRLGRNADGKGDVAIDIDIMKYDDTKMHADDWERGYIKDLLKSIDNN